MSSMLRDVMHVQGVLGVHDLHVWSISSGLRSMSAHIVTDDIPISAGAVIQARISELFEPPLQHTARHLGSLNVPTVRRMVFTAIWTSYRGFCVSRELAADVGEDGRWRRVAVLPEIRNSSS